MQYKEFSSTEKKVCGIIFCNPPDPLSGKTALKYQWVRNSPFMGVQTFITFAKKFPTAQYINFYSNKDGSYLGRIYLH